MIKYLLEIIKPDLCNFLKSKTIRAESSHQTATAILSKHFEVFNYIRDSERYSHWMLKFHYTEQAIIYDNPE